MPKPTTDPTSPTNKHSKTLILIMKKAQRPILPDPIFTFDDTAVVLMRTQYLPYQLALMLNDTYRLQLSRISDIDIDGIPHPCFFYNDDASWLVHILIARPPQPGFNPILADYDKMLLIRGRDSWRFQQKIYDQLNSRRYGLALGSAAEPDPTDLLEHSQWEQLNKLTEGIQGIDIFGFSPRRDTVSTLRLADSEPTLFPLDPSEAKASESRAIANYHKKLTSFLELTFESLHAHLSDEEELGDSIT